MTPPLSQSSGFTFGLEQAQDVVFADCGPTNVSLSAPSSQIIRGSRHLRFLAHGGCLWEKDRWGYRTWALDVADNASGGIVHELDSDLSDTSSGTCDYQPLALPSLAPLILAIVTTYQFGPEHG
jgi:hypothetical protein